ncbi:uncharacterized protein ASPGLDRAFT_1329509 [Aspergillus glaucus CBS 516.65]|uniref:Uncharacterized protein n=1 Tax=Aspergillus glaucus CBS 516.65 TaxID=1160497 RepID=A0A1L9VQK1_ASPGL|nr:hypothetical protein ASPGLDRAFT_1329509 [Aspergillus glaucus CBS 516.65]OJJ86195.1 hypothetical protein ASPGLDRAFT_1329509 [Aspergillus glaucus CBS 516.65]
MYILLIPICKYRLFTPVLVVTVSVGAFPLSSLRLRSSRKCLGILESRGRHE